MTGIPDNLHSVTPSLTVTPCDEAIEFCKNAFGAVENSERMTGPDGVVAHAEIRIGDSVIMLGDEWPDAPTRSPKTLNGSSAALFIYTDDVDALWDRAISAGCEVVYPLEMQFYGDKGGRVRDPFGHTWGLGQHIEALSEEEMAKRVEAFYSE